MTIWLCGRLISVHMLIEEFGLPCPGERGWGGGVVPASNGYQGSRVPSTEHRILGRGGRSHDYSPALPPDPCSPVGEGQGCLGSVEKRGIG